MPLLEETADLSSLSTGGNTTSTNPAGSVINNNSVPSGLPTGIPPSVAQQIRDAQNSGIQGTPQRRGTPGEKEIPIGTGQNRLPPTPPKPIPEVGQGVDFFGNENVKGFVTNTYFQRTDHVEPLRPNTGFQDSKGDVSRLQNSPNRKFNGTNSRLVGYDIPVELFLDNKNDYPPLFNQDNLFTAKFRGSRLEDIGNDGFFESYYSLGLDNTSGLGYRSNNKFPSKNLGFSGYLNPQLKKLNAGINIIGKYVFGKEPKKNTLPSFEVASDRVEPFIVRAIGERWGVDRVPKPRLDGLVPALVQVDKPAHKGKDVVDSFFNVIDDVGKRLVGREPSVFLDRYFADVRRINGATNSLDFLVRGSRFVQAQSALQKRNPFNVITSTLYDLSDEGKISLSSTDLVPKAILNNAGEDFLGGLGQNNIDLNLDPKSYNPLSVFSVPGVLGINRSSYLDLSQVINKGTIVDTISEQVYEEMEKQAIELGKVVGKRAVEWGKHLGTELGKAADAIGGSLSKLKLPSLSLGAKKSKLNSIDLNLPKINLPDLNLPDINLPKVDLSKAQKSAQSIINTAEGALKKAKGIASQFDLIPDKSNMPASKAALAKLSKNAFDERGRDRVNLIPYNTDRYKSGAVDLPLDELDWIPFKFVDTRLKDDKGGGSMVFRAILSGITDTFTPEFNPEKYVGRPDPVYVYQGVTREIAFTFDVYPKSDVEMVTLWEKLNYLAGQTYPHWTSGANGMSMMSPLTELTIGEMYLDTPGYISSLTFTVMDNGNWETSFAKLPKYIQVSCTFVYIGNKLPAATQKHFEVSWLPEQKGPENKTFDTLISQYFQNSNFEDTLRGDVGKLDSGKFKKLLGDSGLGG